MDEKKNNFVMLETVLHTRPFTLRNAAPGSFFHRGIFTPFRERITSCRSSYRSPDEESTAVPRIYIYIGTMAFMVSRLAILYMQTESVTLLPGEETVNFQNCRRQSRPYHRFAFVRLSHSLRLLLFGQNQAERRIYSYKNYGK